MSTLTSFESDLTTGWSNGTENGSGTALLEPDHLEEGTPAWSENFAACGIDDDVDDDEAYFLDDEEDDDDDFGDDYDDDDFDDDDYDSDSDDEIDDDDF